jgi:GTPase
MLKSVLNIDFCNGYKEKWVYPLKITNDIKQRLTTQIKIRMLMGLGLAL